MTLAKLCALLIGGATVGSVGTVAVQQVRDKAAKSAKAVKPRAHALPRVAIMDCPLPGNGAAVLAVTDLSSGFAALSPGGPVALPTFPGPALGGGGGLTPFVPLPPIVFPPSPLPPVPELDSWALMLGGFGLVGMAMRKRREAA